MKPVNVLNARQKYQLASWVQAKCEELRRVRATLEEAARRASEELGFPVVMSNVTTARDAAGVTWKAAGPRAGGTLKKDVERLSGAMPDVCSTLRAICGSLTALCERMDEEMALEEGATWRDAIHPGVDTFLNRE